METTTELECSNNKPFVKRRCSNDPGGLKKIKGTVKKKQWQTWKIHALKKRGINERQETHKGDPQKCYYTQKGPVTNKMETQEHQETHRRDTQKWGYHNIQRNQNMNPRNQ